MIKAIIIDDEQHCINQLKKLMQISKIEFSLVSSFTSFKDATKEMKTLEFDVLFLDVQVEDNLAFDFLLNLPPIDFAVIFTTAYQQYAIRAFKFSAVDYLLKPIDREEFDEAARKIKTRLEQQKIVQNLDVLFHNLKKENNHKKISLPTQEGFIFVEIQDIIRCQADVNYTHFHLQGNQRITVSKSLKHYDDLLIGCDFFRVHNSHLINMDYVKNYIRGKGGYVTMADNSKIEVSTRRKEGFLKKLKEFS